jgi:hypothetical protein
MMAAVLPRMVGCGSDWSRSSERLAEEAEAEVEATTGRVVARDGGLVDSIRAVDSGWLAALLVVLLPDRLSLPVLVGRDVHPKKSRELVCDADRFRPSRLYTYEAQHMGADGEGMRQAGNGEGGGYRRGARV